MPLCDECMTEQVSMVLKLQHSAAQRGALTLWTLFDHPKDYPNGFIARRFEVNKDGLVQATDHTLSAGPQPDELQDVFRKAGLVCVGRMSEDDPVIVETWI